MGTQIEEGSVTANPLEPILPRMRAPATRLRVAGSSLPRRRRTSVERPKSCVASHRAEAIPRSSESAGWSFVRSTPRGGASERSARPPWFPASARSERRARKTPHKSTMDVATRGRSRSSTRVPRQARRLCHRSCSHPKVTAFAAARTSGEAPSLLPKEEHRAPARPGSRRRSPVWSPLACCTTTGRTGSGRVARHVRRGTGVAEPGACAPGLRSEPCRFATGTIPRRPPHVARDVAMRVLCRLTRPRYSRRRTMRISGRLPWGCPPYDACRSGQRPTSGLPDPTVQRLQAFSTS